MALYQGLNRPRSDEAADWKVKRHGASAEKPSFLDRMLGQGSRDALRSSADRSTSSPKAAPLVTRRFQTVGGTADAPARRGQKGLIRAGLLLAFAGWGLAAIQPRERLAPLLSELAQLLRSPQPKTTKAQVQPEKPALEAALSPTPEPDWENFDGTAMALWQDNAGAWWQVSQAGGMLATQGPREKGNLGLPMVVGAALRTRPRKDGFERMLVFDTALSVKALPLLGELRSEVRAVSLRAGEGLILYMHDGTRAELGVDDLTRRQRRLARVLADLNAKRRRATLVDLRYQDTAVVRMAAR